MNDTQPIDRPDTGTDVAILGPVTALAVFGTDGGVDAILEKIRAQARAVETDISTTAGRAAVASLAYKISRSKSALNTMGKELGEDTYRRWKAITSERSRIETELDALRDEIRAPLTDYENAEKARVSEHERALGAICEAPRFYFENTSDDLRQRLAYLEAYPARDWQEFAKRAADTLAGEIQRTKTALVQTEALEAARAEGERLEKEKAAQAQREREALIAANARREAEEKARREATAEANRAAQRARQALEEAADKASREREAIEAQKLAAEERAKEANRRADEAEAARIAATAKARADLEAAAAAARGDRESAVLKSAALERQRIEDAQAKDAAQTAGREANARHRGQIHAEARDALTMAIVGLTSTQATEVITAIARGTVPHVRVIY